VKIIETTADVDTRKRFLDEIFLTPLFFLTFDCFLVLSLFLIWGVCYTRQLKLSAWGLRQLYCIVLQCPNYESKYCTFVATDKPMIIINSIACRSPVATGSETDLANPNKSRSPPKLKRETL